MTDIEKKALALLNECGWRGAYIKRKWDQRYEALCRAIEKHEAFRQEVSEALLWHCKYTDGVLEGLQHLIIADPDPLVEAWIEATGNTVGMEPLNEALAKRGGKIVWENSDA